MFEDKSLLFSVWNAYICHINLLNSLNTCNYLLTIEDEVVLLHNVANMHNNTNSWQTSNL